MIWYNDSDPFVAQWLRNLIAAGNLPAGDVDERPIQEVQPDDLKGYTQCHFFAGIGGWPYALQLAGLGDRPVWTGSCPCQPFSAAGKRQAHDDARHLWPAWFRLIRECRPERIFGEQVAGAAGLGWLDVVSTDLEAEAYTVGAVVLGAHSVGAPHIRQRLWFVADRDGGRREQRDASERIISVADAHGAIGELGHTGSAERQKQRGRRLQSSRPSEAGRRMGNAAESGRERHQSELQPSRQGEGRLLAGSSDAGFVADADGGHTSTEGLQRSGEHGFWAQDCVLVPCRDGKARPTQSGVFPLAHGISGRVGRLRAYGNAIVPQVAAEFVRAYMETAP